MNTDERRVEVGALAILAVGRRGAALGARIQRQLGGDLFIPERFAQTVDTPALAYGEGELKGEMERAFRTYQRLAVVLPVGAAVRLIAPLLGDKHTDPAVVAIDEAGAHVVALVSGHEGGANELARQVAATIGAHPVITTAAEALGSLALDLLGKEWGWTIEDPTDLTRASAAMIDGAPIGVYQDAGEEDWWSDTPPSVERYSSPNDLFAAPASARLIISDRVLDLEPREASLLVYRPRSLVVGVGCVRGASAEEIEALVAETLERNGLARASVRELATIDLKRDEAGITELAQRNGWTVRYFTSGELAAVEPPSGRSAVVEQAVGTPGVCEPAALLASGDGGELVVPKARTDRATVAVARVRAQRGEGCLSVVGLGPGAREEMTEHARATLEAADAIVGYHGYLDQVRPWLMAKRYHGSPIGEEVERCRLAIELARAGQRVALVSSGDAGIYGTAGIVLELLAEDGAWDEAAALEIVPGVSAANMAAALLGAPLMSDFATISLSDLMTPWEVIERRIEAVAASDIVVALYNPASMKRRDPLTCAIAILREHRAPDTPVGLVRNASRPGQQVTLTDLGHVLDQPIDMLTLVLVGNSATTRVGTRLVTRRGYRVAAT